MDDKEDVIYKQTHTQWNSVQPREKKTTIGNNIDGLGALYSQNKSDRERQRLYDLTDR